MASVRHHMWVLTLALTKLLGPAPRDDVESLGYSLLHLISGVLPWLYNVLHGTRKTQHDQVRIKKQRHNGASLAPGGMPCIGEMVDYARSLNIDQLPNYDLLRSQIHRNRKQAALLDLATVEWHVLTERLPGLSPFVAASPPT